jgi:hypothetical protein
MKNNRILWFIPAVLLAILPACSPAVSTQDTYAIYTAAANTVQAELTNAALLTPSATATGTATETPLPTPDYSPTPEFSLTPLATATTGQLMDKAEFVGQSIADRTNFPPNSPFRVVWTLRNVGPTTWTNQYSLRFIGGNQMGAVSSVPLTTDASYNETTEIGVDFTAPATLGATTSNWCLYNASNQCFYPVFIEIVVASGTGSTPAVTVTITPTP